MYIYTLQPARNLDINSHKQTFYVHSLNGKDTYSIVYDKMTMPNID